MRHGIPEASVMLIILITGMLPLLSQGAEEDPTTLAAVWTFVKEDDEATFWKLAWSPDGTMIAATFFDNKCLILDAEDGTVIEELDMSDHIT
ncbi:MAG TPA: hypothetical protein ENK47_02910, partial [Euryarchaeota archaeon]|nr:hypothetical protein [Euryarchaeota archaeon]